MRISRIIAATAIGIFFCAALSAENAAVEDEDRPAPDAYSPTAVATAVKPAVKSVLKKSAVPAAEAEETQEIVKPTPVPAQVEDLRPKLSAMKSSLSEIKAQNETLAASIKEMQASIKAVEDKNTVIKGSVDEKGTEIKNAAVDIELLKSKLSGLEEKYSRDRDVIEKYGADFTETKETIKTNVDKLQSWSDIIDVLKKQINDNEMEIAKIKKTVNDLKGQYGDDGNAFIQVLKWPYAGFTALVLSTIALSVALSK